MCHECRFCCTLPMCTQYPGGKDDTTFDMDYNIELRNQDKKILANAIFYSNNHIYKNDDYHCLKPNSHKDPKQWHKYDAIGYRKAYNQTMLDNTISFKYDNNLHNFADPKVLKAFTKSEKEGRKIFKKSYKYHYTAMIQGDHYFGMTNYQNLSRHYDLKKCIKKCSKMEKSKFATKCLKQGGYFKCCISPRRFTAFEDARNKLIKDGLIKDKPTNICNREAEKDPCHFCRTNGICTIRNQLNGKTSHYFYPKMKERDKSKYRIWCF